MKTYTLIALALLIFQTNTGFAQSGSLDTTFSKDGKIKSTSLEGGAIAVQNDGKILVMGSSTDFSVIRLNANGSLDKTFGDNGIASAAYSFYGFKESSLLAVQADGKIIIAGYSIDGDDIFYTSLARFKTNGELDSSFGTNGGVKTEVHFYVPSGITIASNGKILLSTINQMYPLNDVLILEYNANGSLYNQFGYDSGPNTPDVSNALAIQSNNKLVVTGRLYDNDSQSGGFGLLRFKPNGSLDNSFGADSGKTILDYGEGLALAIQSNDKIVVIAQDSILFRFTKNGLIDNTFGTNGITKTPFQGYAVAIQADGKIIVAGSTDSNFAIVRYKKNGKIDPSFGTNGIVQTNFNGDDQAQSIAIQADKKILVAGVSVAANQVHSGVIARYNSESANAGFVSIDNINAKQTLAVKVYPNPVQSVLNIELNKSLSNKTISIYDIKGKLLITKTSDGNTQIDMKQLTAGTYLIKINDASGKLLYNGKVIKQ